MTGAVTAEPSAAPGGVNGGLISTEYRFSTSTVDGDPGSGRFRYDDAVHASVTEIFIDDINNQGVDVSNFLAQISAGDRLYIQQENDASRFAVWNVILDAIDETGWFSIGVSLEADGATLANNARSLFIWAIAGNTDFAYLRLDTANDPLTGELQVQDVVPVNNQQRSVGLVDQRFNRIHGRLGMFVGESNSSGAIVSPQGAIRTFNGTAPTGLMIGNQVRLDTGVTELQLQGGSYKAIMTAGNVFSYSTGAARILNIGGGSLAFGSAFSYGAGDALINVTGPGSFTCCYAYTGYGAGGKNHTLLNSGIGSFLGGYSYGFAQIDVTSSGQGSFVQGFFSGTNTNAFSVMRATAAGAFAQGAIANNSALTSTLEAIAAGAFAQGHVAGEGTIRASGFGAFAQGRAAGGGMIEATFPGSFAHGLGLTNDIRASGNGAFAIGDATAGDIIASGANSCQFGPGTNTLADTFQIGDGGIRFKGTTGAPSALQNGDIWVASGYLYFRTNGVSVKMVACP